MAKEISGSKAIGTLIFLVVFSMIYYKYFLKIEPNANKKVEMLKRYFIFMIVVVKKGWITIIINSS